MAEENGRVTNRELNEAIRDVRVELGGKLDSMVAYQTQIMIHLTRVDTKLENHVEQEESEHQRFNDHEGRIRSTEKWRYALPASIVTTILTIAFSVFFRPQVSVTSQPKVGIQPSVPEVQVVPHPAEGSAVEERPAPSPQPSAEPDSTPPSPTPTPAPSPTPDPLLPIPLPTPS